MHNREIAMSENLGHINTEIRQQVATIEFYHPAGNSLPGRLLQDLARNLREMGRDDRVRVIILRSAGHSAFCAGASFDELMAIEDAEAGLRFFSGFAEVINAMRECPQFILGRIQGKAVGGGVGLASATDYAYATTAASIKLSELAVGIGPFVVGPAVERKIGRSAFSQLAIDATEWRSADWAKRHGLYAEVHANEEEMDEALDHLSQKLAGSHPAAMSELKKVFWRGTEDWDRLLMERAAISGRLVLSDFTRQAIEKFRSRA